MQHASLFRSSFGVLTADAIEEDHLAIYPAQGPVKCSTVCAVDYSAAGAERYYPINSKYLLRGGCHLHNKTAVPSILDACLLCQLITHIIQHHSVNGGQLLHF